LRQLIHCLNALKSTLLIPWLPEAQTFGSHIFCFGEMHTEALTAN
jgi:hypothetical protein